MTQHQLICRRCHRRTERRSVDACTWWPPECVTGLGPWRRPRVCWDCCDEDERLDLVDAGCPLAIQKARNWP
jgi:hypothetical protein